MTRSWHGAARDHGAAAIGKIPERARNSLHVLTAGCVKVTIN
jgi:hypothetical protein